MFKKQKLNSIIHCTFRKQWKQCGSRCRSAWYLLISEGCGSELGSLPDIEGATLSTRQMDIVGWLYPYKLASAEWQHDAFAEKRLLESCHTKKLWTLISRTVCWGHLAPRVKPAFALDHSRVYKLCLQNILQSVYILKLLQSYVKGLRRNHWMYGGPIFNFCCGREEK